MPRRGTSQIDGEDADQDEAEKVLRHRVGREGSRGERLVGNRVALDRLEDPKGKAMTDAEKERHAREPQTAQHVLGQQRVDVWFNL